MERYSKVCFMAFNLGQGTENTCYQCLIMLNTMFLRTERALRTLVNMLQYPQEKGFLLQRT